MQKYKVAFQVMVFALLEGPQPSKVLRRAVMGQRYADTKGSPNTRYNNLKNEAVAAKLFEKNEFGWFELREEGLKLKAWADENSIDLSQAKTVQQINWELANPETSADA